jgi:IS5 family transposase
MKKYMLTDETQKLPKTSLEMSYIMTIAVFFHLSNHRYFKWYYKNFISGDPRVAGFFGKLVSYNRFVEIMQSVAAPLTLYLMKHGLGKCSGISFLDSTTLDVCDIKRMYSHKVFDGIAKKSKTSTGWFFGFKLHLAINDRGEIIAFCITPGNVDDRDWNVISKLTKEMFGKVFADKGYLSAPLFDKLYKNGIQLITKLKKNMKNKLIPIEEAILLRKRAIIECVNDFLKNICQIEHSRHRSVANFLVNLISGLIAYSFLPKKPSLYVSDNFCYTPTIIA